MFLYAFFVNTWLNYCFLRRLYSSNFTLCRVLLKPENPKHRFRPSMCEVVTAWVQTSRDWNSYLQWRRIAAALYRKLTEIWIVPLESSSGAPKVCCETRWPWVWSRKGPWLHTIRKFYTRIKHVKNPNYYHFMTNVAWKLDKSS